MIIDNLATLPVTIQLSINGVEIINFFLLSRVLICIDTSVLVHHHPPPPPQHQSGRYRAPLLLTSHLALPAFSVSTHTHRLTRGLAGRIFKIYCVSQFFVTHGMAGFCQSWSSDLYTEIIETFIQFMLIYFQEGWREGWISAPVLNFDKPRQVPSWDAGGREGRAWMTDLTPKHSLGSWIITRPR